MTAATLATPAALVASGVPVVASYARRSKRAAGDGQGATINIADQHAQNRAYAAAAFPGAVVVEYDDNMTAWAADATREGWDRLLDDVRAGSLAAVVGRYPDRLTRQPEQGEALLSACRRSGAALHTTSAGPVESALAVRILWAVAAEESDQKSRRMTDTHRRLADAGAFQGGPRRFGFEPRMTDVREAEAVEIRAAVARVLAGESLRSIARDWNDRGVWTVSGKAWDPRNLGQMLRGVHLAKLRVHKGTTTAATWAAPAVLTPAQHEAVTRYLTNPDRRVSPASGARVHALSGVLLCAVCDGAMYGRPTRTGPAYTCRNGQHVQAPTAKVDALVFRAIARRLSRVDASGVFVDPVDMDAANARAAERVTLTTTRAAMPAQLGVLSPADYAAGLAAIDARLAELDDEAMADDEAARAPLRVLDGLTGHPEDVTRRLFADVPADRQRAVIAVLGVPALGRASRRGRGLEFEPERVSWRWSDVGA